jgi:hypothetical protein
MWVVGFVDGEGCFSVSVHRNALATRTGGWQLQPVFQVSQHEDHVGVLDALARFFGCGRVRRKGPTNPVLAYSVYGCKMLRERIIPFFEENELKVKGDDFMAFAAIVRSLEAKEHNRPEEFARLVRLAYGMNGRGRQRSRRISDILPGSSETVREASPRTVTMRQSDPHGDMGSRAEMTRPLA